MPQTKSKIHVMKQVGRPKCAAKSQKEYLCLHLSQSKQEEQTGEVYGNFGSGYYFQRRIRRSCQDIIVMGIEKKHVVDIFRMRKSEV